MSLGEDSEPPARYDLSGRATCDDRVCGLPLALGGATVRVTADNLPTACGTVRREPS